jgi:hypothetical protein
LPFVFYVLVGAEVENSKTKYTTHMDFIKVAGHNKINIKQQKQKKKSSESQLQSLQYYR